MQNQLAYQVSIISIFLNILLSLCKLAAGIFAMSGAMISDAMHSLSDVFSTFLVIASIKISGKEADKEHPYGHEKIESIFAFILAFFLATVGIGIGANGRVYNLYPQYTACQSISSVCGLHGRIIYSDKGMDVPLHHPRRPKNQFYLSAR